MAIKGDKGGRGVRAEGAASSAKRAAGSRRVTARATFDLEEAVAAETAAPSRSMASFAGAGMGRRFGSNVKDQDVTDFLRQFIMLLEAGTPLLRALSILSTRGERAGIRALVSDITQFVESGNALWQAFERWPKQFDPVFINLVKASEASGTLNVVLKRLVKYRERRGMLRRRVFAALMYPCILVVAAALVLFLIAKIVVPEFKDLFDRLGIDPPAYTKFFIRTMETLTNPWFIGSVVAIVVGVIVAYKLLGRSPWWRLKFDRWKISIPKIGKSVVRKTAVVEFTRSMSLLLRSGLSMMVTLDLVRSNVHNTAVANVMQHVRDSVERGEGIEEPLRRANPVIPPVVTDMLVTGEESGQLDQIAEHIAETYEEEVNITLGAIGEMIQPIMTVIIGIVVGLLFLALFVPMIDTLQQLSSSTGAGNS
ncbi:MAG TPA: type II secretion system F family protein [Candidatus Hydrogenedentes bacterium]|nr:type II secretion system F family protein [Candidatus Hydrogenedentota bacterium]HRK34890.1 type II secretion system F family protein [Candidatus Hydrogenedentota bacterium]